MHEGQVVKRARLLLEQSEFEFRWCLQIYCKIVVEKNEYKLREAAVGPFNKNVMSYPST